MEPQGWQHLTARVAGVGRVLDAGWNLGYCSLWPLAGDRALGGMDVGLWCLPCPLGILHPDGYGGRS